MECEMIKTCTPAESKVKTNDDIVHRVKSYFQAKDLVRRGVCLLNAGLYEEAAQHFTASQKIHPQVVGMGSTRTTRDENTADISQAGYGQSKAANIANCSANNPIRGSNASGNRGQTVVALRQALMHDPDAVDIHFQLGTLFAADEDFETAALHFGQVIAIEKNHADALVSLAMIHGVLNAPGEAVRYLRRAQRVRPHDAKIGLLLTLAARAAHAEGQSVNLWATLTATDDEESNVIEELAGWLQSDLEFVEAFLLEGTTDRTLFTSLAEAMEKVAASRPGDAKAHYYHARLLERLGCAEEAILAGERAIQIDPRFVQALIQLARLYQQTDRSKDARHRLECALEIGAEYADVYYQLGNLYRDQGEVHRARDAYHHALRINHKYEEARQALHGLAA